MPVTTPAPIERVNDVMSDLINETVAQALVLRDDTSPASTVPAETPASPPTDTPVSLDDDRDPTEPDAPRTPPPEDAPQALPEGLVAIPRIEGSLATDFTVSDADGEIEPPNLLIDFAANGKARREPLDKVVKLAQWGVYNHDRHQQAEAALQESLQSRETVKQLQDQVAAMHQAREELMSSDEAYLKAREDYDRRNTPEAKLAAREERLVMETERVQFEQASRDGATFLDQRIEPALDMIAKNLPTVTAEELAARTLLFANKYTVMTRYGSIIDPRAHMLIAKGIAEDILPWAQQVHDARVADQQGVLSMADKRVASARVDSQKAKNLVARAVKPTGRTAPETQSRKVPRTADEAHDDVLRATFEAMGLSR